MSSFKKLSKADVTTVPYAANKQWLFFYDDGVWPSTLNQYAITDYTGINTGFIGDAIVGNYYPSLVYAEINHLFYQSYTGSLNTGSLMFNVNTYQSASQQRPTASYFNYNINPLLIKQYPTGSGDNIDVIVVNQNIYGSKILPTSFQISSSNGITGNNHPVLIKDDGNGNLYDIAQAQSQYVDLNWVTLNYIDSGSLTVPGIFFVGNIFYAHGITVITNPNYLLYNITTPSDCTSYAIDSLIGETVFQYTDCFTGLTKNITLSVAPKPTNICSQTVPIVISGTGDITPGAECAVDPVYWTISFQNEHIIHENEVRCIIKESDYNLTYNPTLLKYGGQYIANSSGSNYKATGSYSYYTSTGSFDTTVKDFATGSAFQPYVTTIGLYNDENELLMVAKLAKPISLSSDTDMTFIVRYDT